ncbi:hypothetical protein [Francisella orientalis]|uniref:Uncharacterized protein n=1 Tax=Francisella orientalis TaxID=299583 RepID=A0AAP6XBD5_9GAMM|nr:hypothetical protein [Francisella orientalis]AHB99256.1 hypothetical protein M973_06985 [Francisella orientalis LADL 07-285A]AKN85839.1 hypothetical protein FNO12_1249 [Francisella orientalis FNO12]AKN87378.1 Hypothetical protein FNO24_1251 [Francisella orientalis FNO24]AKN88915.1 Hypothetical protein FNO190_1249 [Francisella orientalis]AKU05674.1 Hypothetical protein FNO01_1249 [Francisella orientalis]
MKYNLQKELFSKILKNIPEYAPMELISEIDYYGFSKYLADRLGIKKLIVEESIGSMDGFLLHLSI